jgi:hypothetical protein
VLVNPPVGSKPLELTAAVARDKPRPISIVDSAATPVVGVTTQGLTFHPWDTEPRLRSASFLLTKLHPDRVQRITFIEEKRGLIGFLMARGNGHTAYTVRMQPWAIVTGRLLDENGQPFPTQGPRGLKVPAPTLSINSAGIVVNSDRRSGEYGLVNIDGALRFRIDHLVPGQRYTAKVYRGIGLFAGNAFENLVLGPGEVRDLGDIRTKPAVDVRGK